MRNLHAFIVDQLSVRYAEVGERLDDGKEHILVFTVFPKEVWRQIWSKQSLGAPQQGDPAPYRRCRDLPNHSAIIRLVGVLLCEQTDESAIGRRYMILTSLRLARDRSRSFQPRTRGEALPESLPLSA